MSQALSLPFDPAAEQARLAVGLPSDCRGLSLTQPWASLVAGGHKRVETRSWPTAYRGAVLIHAAKGFPRWAQEFAAEERAVGRLPGRIPRGAIVAVATLVNVQRTDDVASTISSLERHLGNYDPGRWAWFLSEIHPLQEPVPCRGALGLWHVPGDVLRRFMEASA